MNFGLRCNNAVASSRYDHSSQTLSKLRTQVASRRYVNERNSHAQRLDAMSRSGWMLCSSVMKERVAASRYGP